MASPPDLLRLLCLRLTSTAPEELPRLCPALVAHVLRCGDALAVPTRDVKNTPSLPASDTSSSYETSALVVRLKNRLTALLTGPSAPGRLAAVALIKAVVDVGGRACLETSDPWIRGLVSLLQVCAPPTRAEAPCES